MTLDMHLRLQWRLVRRTDAGELLDDAVPGLLVQPLRIPLLRHLDGHIDVDLHERQAGLLAGRGYPMQRPRRVPVRAVRRDERGDGDRGTVGEQLGDLGDPPDVLVAILLTETQVLIQPEADVVAVQAVGGYAAVAEQLVFQFDRDGRLARGGQAGQPDRETLLFAESGALATCEGSGVIGNVTEEGSVVSVIILQWLAIALR